MGKEPASAGLPVGHSFQEDGSILSDAQFASGFCGVVHSEDVVTIHSDGRHPIPRSSWR